MKKVWTILIVFLIGVLIYYKFFSSNPEERAKADRVFSIAKDLGKELVGVMNNEIQREREHGTYSTAFGKVQENIQNLRNSDTQGQFKDKLAELEAQKKALEEATKATAGARSAAEDAETQAKIKKLAEDIGNLASQMEKAK